MLKVLYHSLKARFTITRIVISTMLLILYGCPSTCRQLSLTQGQDAHLTFPYPCDSTEVTLQHSYRTPFYRLTDEQSRLLPQDQVQRLRVQNRTSNGNCSLDLTISDVMRSDEGTYLSSVYKDGKILIDDTYRIYMYIDIRYPPGKASCVEGEERGGDWVAIECTASVESLSGKIECYQNGEMNLSLTNPVETHTTLTQIIIVRKSQPVFCCSSALNENKGRCECNDTALYLPGDNSQDPCPTTSTITAALIYNSTENTQTDHFSTIISYTPVKIKEDNFKSVMVHLILVPIEVILIFIGFLYVFYKLRTNTRTNHNDNDPPQNIALMHTENGTRTN